MSTFSTVGESLVFIDEHVQQTQVKISFKELTTKPLPWQWRNFISDHFLDPKRKHKRYTFPRDKVKTNESFSEFFEGIMEDEEHIVTECLETYKVQFEKNYIIIQDKKQKMEEAVSNIREFITCFSLFLAKEWGISIGFFSIVFRAIAINLINKLHPLLIGLYIWKPRNQELSVLLQSLESAKLELSELGIPEHLQVDFEVAWKILRKTTRSQNIVAIADVLNYFYYQIFLCIDEKSKHKVKVKDVELSKIIMYCIAKAGAYVQNVHCIVELCYDFSRGLISEKDYSVVKLIHSIFSWIKASVKIEKDDDFKRYNKRTFVGAQKKQKQAKSVDSKEDAKEVSTSIISNIPTSTSLPQSSSVVSSGVPKKQFGKKFQLRDFSKVNKPKKSQPN